MRCKVCGGEIEVGEEVIIFDMGNFDETYCSEECFDKMIWDNTRHEIVTGE